jgi:hypothetical protein
MMKMARWLGFLTHLAAESCSWIFAAIHLDLGPAWVVFVRLDS